eukprot:GILI01033758.1.p1 GENE.GILI01033758.1~~GILI01033758.1.p1  ORF type:complete len:111 (+),score=34.35 GILI01033758.1:41-373(+)
MGSSKLLAFFLLAIVCFSFVAAHENHEPHYVDGKHNPNHKHSESEVAEHKDDFDSFDVNKDGIVDAQEVRKSVPSISQEELAEFFSIADKDGSGSIDFDEYLHAALVYNA